ncbi:hypothetical protein D3C86_2142120 [compost metagenome]
MLACPAQGFRMTEFPPARIAQSEGTANSLSKHLVRGVSSDTLQLTAVMGEILQFPVAGVPFDEIYQTPAKGFLVPVVTLR